MGEQKNDMYWSYEIEKGDTLWGISAKYEVSKIQRYLQFGYDEYNNE